jgi:hypothetical protein
VTRVNAAQLAVALLVMLAVLVVLGSGRYSIDAGLTSIRARVAADGTG